MVTKRGHKSPSASLHRLDHVYCGLVVDTLDGRGTP